MSWMLAVLWAVQARAMAPGDLERLAAQLHDTPFSDDQLAVLGTAASTNTFTCDQVRRLLGGFPFSSDQKTALAVLAPRIEDPANTAVILDAFVFSSDRSEAEAILRSSVPAPRPDRPRDDDRPECPADAGLPALQVTWGSTWPDADLDALVATLDATPFSSDQLAALRTAVAGRPDTLTGPQVVRLLRAFDFSSDLDQVVDAVDEHLTGMTVTELRGVLDAFPFSDGKLGALEAFRFAITDVEHKHELLDAFTFGSDKAAAGALLDDVVPRSFLYGTVYSQRVVFVVDTSGSMGATFTTNQGLTLSRLDFVRCELSKVVRHQLAPAARFDVIAFSDGVTAWQPELVDASPEHRVDARRFVGRQRPAGGTNVYDALERAFALRPDVIYLLTDGAPSVGRTDPREIALAVKGWSGGAVKVHAVAFLAGGDPADDDTASRRLMRRLAEETGGVYRAIE